MAPDDTSIDFVDWSATRRGVAKRSLQFFFEDATMPKDELRGRIDLGAAPESWGFTEERFLPGSYLWRVGDEVYWSFVATRHQGAGHLSALRRAIEADGLRVAVPTPLPKMEAIVTRWGFKPTTEQDPVMGPVKVWRF